MLEEQLRSAIAHARREACTALVSKLEDEGEEGFAAELGSATDDSDLLCELIRARIIAPTNNTASSRIRQTVGWNVATGAFNGLLPEYWDLVSLLPSRERAVRRTLRSLMEDQLAEEGQLLDAGCGTGLLASLLVAVNYPGHILGYDTNTAWKTFAAARGLKRFTAEDRDITTIREEEKFDAIVCYMVLHHVPGQHDWQEALRRFFVALKPNGVFAYTDVVSPVNSGTEPLAISAPELTVGLRSGQLLHIPPVRLPARRHFKPHPDDAKLEKFREWQEVAQELSLAGFAIEKMDVVDEVTVHFKCRKPDLHLWTNYTSMGDSQRESLRVLELLDAQEGAEVFRKRSPYQFTLPVMAALWHDLMGEGSVFMEGEYPWWRKERRESECSTSQDVRQGARRIETPAVNLNPSSPPSLEDEVEVRAIAFFSWEPDSRQFLVRRAWPHHFHIISYSSVFAGWGSLGRMVEEFENNPKQYIRLKGYSFLDRGDLQRTLPFAGDFESLKYEAALAIPVADDPDGDHPRLLGSYLVYLRRKGLVPVHTGSDYHKEFNRQLRELARKTASILGKQDRAFQYSAEVSREQATAKEWRRLVDTSEGSGLVIAELLLTIEGGSATDPGGNPHLLDVLCAGLVAMLSGPETCTIRDQAAAAAVAKRQEVDLRDSNQTACLLIAARPGMTFDALHERILALIGPAGWRHMVRGLSFSCDLLRSTANG